MKHSRSILTALCLGGLAVVSGGAQSAPLGLDMSTPGYSARQILQSGASADGLYWIDPNGGSAADAFQVYADMTTAGGGWTLGLNSVFGDTSSTTDMIANTGVVGLATGHTRDMSALAIDQHAEIRHRLVNKDGSVRFDGYYTGNYHGVLGSSGWTILGGLVSALGVHDGQDWSTETEDVDTASINCASYFSVPWYYTSCYNAIPVSLNNIVGGPFSQGSTPADEIGSWSIFVRELDTPSLPEVAMPAPGMLSLFAFGLAGLGYARRTAPS